MPARPACSAAKARFSAGEGNVGQRQSGQAVELFAFERRRDLQRPLDAAPELRHAARIVGDAAVAGGEIAGRQVEQNLRQPVAAQDVANGRDVFLIGKEKLDPLKTGRGGAVEPLQEGVFGEEHRQVRGETGHRSSCGRRAASRPDAARC
jgi:hypothetical protein